MKLFSVQDTRIVGCNTLLLTISPKKSRDAVRFYPGQYAAIGFKRHGRPSPMRCFSVVSSPNKPETVQFAMRIQGDFTIALSELKRGDTVFLRGPFGDFVIDEEYDRNIVMLAGGIGITPFMSMARHAAETRSPVPMTLLYSCSSQDDIPFFDELLELERRNPRFRVAFFITQGPTDKMHGCRFLRGRVDEDRLAQLTAGRYNDFTFFLCGPKQFTKSLGKTLLDKGVWSDRIITEEFTPSTTSAASTPPRYSITRWTYGLTAATLMLAAGFFMVLDLARFVPKSLQAQAHAASLTPAAQTSQTPDSSTSSTDTTSATNSTPSDTSSSTNNSSTSPSASSNSTNNSSTTYSSPTPSYSSQQMYQQPMTSVS